MCRSALWRISQKEPTPLKQIPAGAMMPLPMKSDATLPSIGRRYQILRVLGSGGMGAVYQAHDRWTDRQVALKRVKLPTGASARVAPPDSRGATDSTFGDIAAQPTMATDEAEKLGPSDQPVLVVIRDDISRESLQALRLALANEFRTLASLRHPNIVSVLDYGFATDGQPFFTMELLAHGQSLSAASASCSLEERGSLLLQILQALSYLHRRGILHCDLKPANLMCTQTKNGSRVKLLDFGLALLRRRSRQNLDQVLGGTPGYIAPEVLYGQPATPQADLYSFGIVAGEIFTDQDLFRGARTSQLIDAGHALRTLGKFELPPPLQAVIEKLLSPEPQDRFATAEAAARALAQAVGIPEPQESAELRNCVLGSAELVGRDVELGILSAALGEAQNGRGRLLLLGGESGIGKSRLLEELRTLALVAGVCVVSAQASSDRNTDIGLFADPLRMLCLHDAPPPLTASVLKGIIADLPGLLEIDISDPPGIDAQAARQRLMSAVRDMLLNVKQPTLLVLEDLQWAGPDSLEALRGLAGQLADKPLLLIGSYRSEDRPELPSEIPSHQTVLLSRLRRDDIARLSESILGEGRADDRLLDWLTQQSEGNSFFITEAMRAIAEEAGSLDAAGATPLPKGILTGGMVAVLRRRLERVPAWAQPLLQLAAIAGRQLPLDVLRVCAEDLERWLRVCAAAGVLEVHEPSWRFCHDKLRERLVAELPSERQHALHLQVAETIESARAPSGEVSATLAYHYEQAGHLPRAATHAASAGAIAFHRGALAQALSLLRKARELQDALAAPLSDKLPTQRMLAETLYGLARFEDGVTAVDRALVMVGRPIPRDKPAIQRALLTQITRKLKSRFRLIRSSKRPSHEELEELQEEALLHNLNIDMSAYLSQMERVIYSILYLANMGDQHRDLGHFFPYSLGLEMLFALSPLPWSVGARVEEVVSMLPRVGDVKTQLLLMRGIGCIYHFHGRQRTARAILEQALTTADALGDTTTQRTVLSFLVRVYACLGEYASSRECAQRLVPLARFADDAQWLDYAVLAVAHAQLRLGEFAAARASLYENQLPHAKSLDHFVAASRALYLAKVGRGEEAKQQLESALNGYEAAPINVVFGVYTYRIPIDTAVLLYERPDPRLEEQAVQDCHRRSMKVLRRFALLTPQGWASLCLMEGRGAWRKGRPKRAAWLFRRALALAERHEEWSLAAQALCWLGRVTTGAAGKQWIDDGVRRLRQFGAASDVAEILS